ncbi:unnamed protein product [Ectocarpus sp. CCAP 1310/34]|nr:unnamed protein product [Ectocarpus sp. CCAP 1310/34]
MVAMHTIFGKQQPAHVDWGVVPAYHPALSYCADAVLSYLAGADEVAAEPVILVVVERNFSMAAPL